MTHEEWERVCAALEDLDSAHHAYAYAALSGFPSVDRYRTRLHETRERLEDEWGFDTRVAGQRRAARIAPKRSPEPPLDTLTDAQLNQGARPE